MYKEHFKYELCNLIIRTHSFPRPAVCRGIWV